MMKAIPRAACALLVAVAVWLGVPPDAPAAAVDSVYTHRAPTPGGTGVVYMGREIARVMPQAGAVWLDRDARGTQERPDLVVAGLDLRPDDVVADIGCGTGYFTFRISPRVPRGVVFAVDIQPGMLAAIRERMAAENVDNVVPVLGTVTSPHLPADSVDVALMVDAYHEFSHPREMMESIVRSLVPGGRVVLVEYRGEDPKLPIKPLHKMTEAQARREMAAAGLRWVKTTEVLPRQHFMVFERPSRSPRR